MFNGPILSQVGSSGGDGIVVTHTDADKQGIAISSTNPTTGAPFVVDHNDSATSAVTPTSMVLDFDKSGVTGDGVTSRYTGFDINMADGATNHTNAKVYITGSSINVSSANNAGHTINTGLEVTVAGGDSNYAALFKTGYVGIGLDEPGRTLDVYGNIASQPIAMFQNGGNDANRYGIGVAAGANDGSGNTYYFLAYDGDFDSGGGVPTPTGYLWSSSTTFALADVSDARVKDNIRDTSLGGLDIVSNLQVRDFELKKNGMSKTGFIAQELKEIWPAAVAGSEDEVDENDNPRIMSVAKSELIPVLVKAVQELTAKVDDLTAEIKLLKGE